MIGRRGMNMGGSLLVRPLHFKYICASSTLIQMETVFKLRGSMPGVREVLTNIKLFEKVENDGVVTLDIDCITIIVAFHVKRT